MGYNPVYLLTSLAVSQTGTRRIVQAGDRTDPAEFQPAGRIICHGDGLQPCSSEFRWQHHDRQYDPTMMSTVLYSHIARKYIPAPQANFAEVVINGESWGVYLNVQQFNKEFMNENFGSDKGARWKVRGRPGGPRRPRVPRRQRGGLQAALRDQVGTTQGLEGAHQLCKVLNKTPLDRLEAALEPILDVDGALWFLALDNALINNDGYWVRASDYSIARDSQGKFHIIPHDMNEAFQAAMMGPGGPGGRGGPGGGPGRPGERGPDGPGGRGFGPPPGGGSRFDLDPLIGLTDARKPLRSKLLAVPSLRAKYLEHVRTIAEESLGWANLGPVVGRFRALIEKEVEADTRKIDPLAAFQPRRPTRPRPSRPAAAGRA